MMELTKAVSEKIKERLLEAIDVDNIAEKIVDELDLGSMTMSIEERIAVCYGLRQEIEGAVINVVVDDLLD